MNRFKLTALIIAFISMGCDGPSTDNGKRYSIDTIEGCEYIIFYSGYGYAAHKGNCTNPIHDFKPTDKEL